MAVAMVAVSLSLATHIAHAKDTVSTQPTKKVYIVGEKFDPTGLAFKPDSKGAVTYNKENDSKFKFSLDTSNTEHGKAVAASELEGFTTAGNEVKVKVFYTSDNNNWGYADTDNLTVVDPAAATSAMTVSGPTTTSYKIGEKLDLTGLKIKFDGTNEWEWSASAPTTGYQLKIGEDVVTNGSPMKAAYNSTALTAVANKETKSSSTSFTIAKPDSIDVKTMPETKYYSSSANKIKLDGLVVTAIYGSGTEATKADVKWGEDAGLTAKIGESAVTSGTTTIASDSVVTLSLMGKTSSIPLYYVTRNKTLSATNAGVSILGDLSSKATELTATKIEPSSTTYTEMHKLITTGYTPVAAYDVSLPANAVFDGYARLTFNVGSEYNGRKAQILHYFGSADFSESEEATVVNGTVTAKFRSLSPFMVAIAPASAETPAPTGTNGANGTTDTNGSSKNSSGNKKTGDSALALGISSIGLLTLSAAGLLLFKKKREAFHFN